MDGTPRADSVISSEEDSFGEEDSAKIFFGSLGCVGLFFLGKALLIRICGPKDPRKDTNRD
jgi:hypothetical protein